MRYIDLIVVHCSATRSNQNFPVTVLIRCHAERFGFTGYHYYITRDGRTYQTRHEQLLGAHAVGYNQHSLGVCYEGGLDEHGNAADTRTPRQKRALLRLLRSPSRCPHPRPSRPPQRPQGLPLLRLFGVFKSLTLKKNDYALHQRPTKIIMRTKAPPYPQCFN